MRAGLMTAGLCGLLAMVVGCEPAGQSRDLAFELHRTEGERDAAARQVSDEQAKSAALQKRIEDEEREWRAARAQVESLKETVGKLTRANEEMKQLLEQQAQRPPERPQVAVSAVPPELDEALAALAKKYTDRLWYDRGRGAVSIADDRLFHPGGDVVRPEALALLQEVAGVLSRTPAEYEIIVVGHTDTDAITREETLSKHPSNWHLSVHRAIAVEEVLSRGGVPAERFGVMGYGEYRPVSGEKSRNRRVEIFVVRAGAVGPLEPVRAEGERK